jgi:hypothetical protein
VSTPEELKALEALWGAVREHVVKPEHDPVIFSCGPRPVPDDADGFRIAIGDRRFQVHVTDLGRIAGD